MGAVPGALAGLRRDDRDDRVVAAPARLPDVQLERRGDLQVAARDVEHVQRAPPLVRILAGVHVRYPVGQLGLRPQRARAERVRLLGAMARHEQQDPRAVGRPLVVFDDPGCLDQLARLADGVCGEGEELRVAGRAAVGEKAQRPAVGRPARPRIAVRAVRDLLHARAVGRGDADATAGLPLQCVEAGAGDRDRLPVGTRTQVARARDLTESR